MIVVNFTLLSAITKDAKGLGMIVINNRKQYREGRVLYADYEARAYPKGVSLKAVLEGATAHRTAIITRHPKASKPVWNLMFKALKELGYE